jgi:tetratricopeptide (TPR) repeat protein
MIRKLGLLLCAFLSLEGCGNLPDSMKSIMPSNAPDTEASATNSLSADTNEIYLGVVEGLNKQKRYGAALAFLDSYIKKGNTPTPHYWTLRGDALLGLGQGSDAVAAFAHLDGTLYAAQGWNGCGRAAALSRNWARAASDFEKAVGQDPANADFLNNLAYADMHLGDTKSSVERLRQAFELDPGSERIRNNLAIALTMKGDVAGVETLFGGIKDETHRRSARALVKKAIQNFNVGPGQNS